MARRLLLAASVVIMAAAALAGCSGGDEADAANVAGRWTGTLSMAYVGTTPTTSGTITVDLNQDDAYASGLAVWAPVGSTQGIAGSLDGQAFTFLLHFPGCPSRNGGVTLTGTVAGEVMTVTGGTGIACFGRTPVDLTVAGAVGSLNRTSDNAQPL